MRPSLVGFLLVLAEVDGAHRIFLKQIGDLVVDRGIVFHLFLQCEVLSADVPEERGGIAQQLGGELSISRHVTSPGTEYRCLTTDDFPGRTQSAVLWPGPHLPERRKQTNLPP